MARVPDEVQAEVAAKAEAERNAVADAEKVFGEDVAWSGEPPTSGIHAKMAYLMATMPDLKPEGKNDHFRYEFWSTDQITGYFRSRFGKLGIAFYSDVESFDIREHTTAKGSSSYLTTILVRFTLVDVTTGDQISGVGIGQGDDPNDKGSNKAMAGALKYWFLKTFLMGGTDAEADSSTDERGNSRRARSVEVGKSSIKGIKRGGRANMATDAQVRQISVMAKELEWSVEDAAMQIGDFLEVGITLPDEPEEQGAALRRFLEGLSSEDAGKVVTRMVELRDGSEDWDAPDEPSPLGY